MQTTTLLKTSLSGMAITYGGDFAVPLFDLNEHFGALQRKVYQAIRSDYPFALDAAGVVTAWGGSIQEKFLKFSLFRENATIELTPTHLILGFQNLAASDVEIVKRCIEKTLDVVLGTCADASLRQEAFNTSCTLDIVDGDAQEHLSLLLGANVKINPVEVGATELIPVFAVELANEEELWRTSANVKVEQNGKALFAFAGTEYSNGNARDLLSQRVDQQFRIINTLLTRIQVEVKAA